MKSIKFKLVIIYLALVFIVMLVGGTFMLAQVRMRETSRARGELNDFARNILEQIILQFDNPEDFRSGFKNAYSYLESTNKMEGYILDGLGFVIAPEQSVGQKFSDYEVMSALSGTERFNNGVKSMDRTGLVKEWITYATPVPDDAPDSDKRVKYVIFVRADARTINENLYDLAVTIVLVLALALTLTGVLGFVFANTLTGPIIRLTRKAKQMTHGNLQEEIPVYSHDEIGQLTDSFNEMARDLSSYMSTVESEKNKLEIIMHNMTDGVLAYDTEGRLIHANNICRELLNIKDLESVGYAEIVQLLENDSTVSIGDKFISATFTPYYNKTGIAEGVVIVLQDVTQHKKLDNMRKEFVANVSHELRTPLTTIKTYTETLIDSGFDNKPVATEFLKIVDCEAERMTVLVKDLLELSRFDNKQLKLEFEVVNLNALIRQSIRQVEMLAGKKNQKIIFDSIDREVYSEVDTSRINQVFVNILSNSIKYSNENAVIEVYTEETDKYCRVYIKDNGIGIPKDDLKHIFERFYRVDKARSRAMGGTGLGLAIAKEIMEAHGGKISAVSEPDNGTTMILRFNKLSDVEEFAEE